jgi:hypothetical protein
MLTKKENLYLESNLFLIFSKHAMNRQEKWTEIIDRFNLYTFLF